MAATRHAECGSPMCRQ
eukprot:jgi/Astpho2/4200/gw1.00064.143.1_t